MPFEHIYLMSYLFIKKLKVPVPHKHDRSITSVCFCFTLKSLGKDFKKRIKEVKRQQQLLEMPEAKRSRQRKAQA